MASLRARAGKENQLNRRVELKRRMTGEREEVSVEDALARIAK
jgi:hypothetical protein